jgi:hypothetical protein
LTKNQNFPFQFPLFSNRWVISKASRYELVWAAINSNFHLLHQCVDTDHDGKSWSYLNYSEFKFSFIDISKTVFGMNSKPNDY